MNDTQKHAFLTALRRGSSVSEAAHATGLSSSAFYRLRKDDAGFAEDWKLALEDSADLLEREARRRAIEGVEEPVVYQGQLTPVWERDAIGTVLTRKVLKTIETKEGVRQVEMDEPVQARNADGSLKYLTIRKPSDALLALLLKGRRKDVFADRTELTGANGGAVVMNDVQRRSRLESILAALAARKKHEDLA